MRVVRGSVAVPFLVLNKMLFAYMRRLAIVCLLATVAAECTLQHACAACGGSFQAARCKCTCPWSTVERSVIAHVGFVLVLILLLA